MNDDENDSFWPASKAEYTPPRKNSKFIKGKSGNPRGRPPKKKSNPKPLVDKSTMESVLKIAKREVTVRDGENVSRISAVDAVIQTMATAAMKGSVPAQKAFVELVDRARKNQASEIQDDHAFWREYAAKYDKHVEALLKVGEPLPEYMPHPDDLVFGEGLHVMVRGGDPVVAAQNRDFIIRFRDLLILQSELDRRCHPSKVEHERNTAIFASEVLFVHANSCLPKRMQLSDDQILFRLFNLTKLPKTSLEQQLKVGWAYFGISYQQNQTTHPITTGVVSELQSLQTYSIAELIERFTHRRGRRRAKTQLKQKAAFRQNL